jgi:peptidoglycan/LPS O-acetylase OafA/YrhL
MTAKKIPDGANRTAEVTAGPAIQHRSDIQVLRGLAVLFVVVQHAGVPLVSGGFLGVDMFFVISGFLVGGIILDACDQHKFSFAEFYLRRARRLLPAAYCTIAVTAVVAALVLDPFELRQFLDQALGAFTFSANFVLWRQVDYFNSAAELKPLLHMWSLAIEEQFYLLAPLLLVFVPARWRLASIGFITLASLALCLYFVQRNPSAAFYLLPFRAWELGAGVLTALLVRHGGALPRWRGIITLIAGAVVVALPFVATTKGHPGLAAIMCCTATAALLAVGTARPVRPALRPLVWLGDRSYSLYLVHWPVFAFAYNVFIDPVPGYLLAILFCLCLMLAHLQYEFVEQRFRRAPVRRPAIAAVLAVPACVAALVFGTASFARPYDPQTRAGNGGLDASCDYRGDFVPRAECESGVAPTALLWGDSFAMHLAPGLAATLPGGLMQATRSVCGPLLDLAPMNGDLFTENWARQCIQFNRSVIDYLATAPQIDVVVLSSVWLQYVPKGEDIDWHSLVHGDDYVAGDLDEDVVLAALKQTVAAVRATGKHVVLVAPPPDDKFDIGRCLSRQQAALPTVSHYPDCSFAEADYRRLRAPVLHLLERVREDNIVPIISLADLICTDGNCRTEIDGLPLYRDEAHLSIPGSIYIGGKMNIGGLVEQLAQ